MNFSDKLFVAIYAWYTNIFDLYLSQTPKDVVLENARVDSNGNVYDITLPNDAKRIKDMEDRILSSMVKTFYVSNIGDDTNDGSRNSPFLSLSKCFRGAPKSGGKLNITLLSDIELHEHVYSNNSIILINLNGFNFKVGNYRNSSTKAILNSWAISGSNNLIEFNGNNSGSSKVTLLAPVENIPLDTWHSAFIRHPGAGGLAKNNSVHFSYKARLIDEKGCNLLSVVWGVGSVSAWSESFLVGDRRIRDLITGVVLSDNDEVINVFSNMKI